MRRDAPYFAIEQERRNTVAERASGRDRHAEENKEYEGSPERSVTCRLARGANGSGVPLAHAAPKQFAGRGQKRAGLQRPTTRPKDQTLS